MAITEVPFSLFLGTFYYDGSESREETIAKLKLLEPYQLGEKPFAVKIIGSARDGSIVRLKTEFNRVKARNWTSRLDDDQQRLINVDEIIEYDCPTVHEKLENGKPNGFKSIAGHLQADDPWYRADSENDKGLKFVLDDGTFVNGRISRQVEMVVLLDYDGPTVWNFKKKSKVQKEAEAAEQMAKVEPYVDLLGQAINPGDLVSFVLKSYSGQGMTGADMCLGKVVRYYPKGGVLIETLAGHEVRLMQLTIGVMLKINSDTHLLAIAKVCEDK